MDMVEAEIRRADRIEKALYGSGIALVFHPLWYGRRMGLEQVSSVNPSSDRIRRFACRH